MRPNGTGLHEILVEGIACGGPLDGPDSIGCNSPVWSPDGRRIVFAVVAGGSSIYVAQGDGSDPQHISVGDGDELPDWGVSARRQ
jgi:Tol biopolymer transport system component